MNCAADVRDGAGVTSVEEEEKEEEEEEGYVELDRELAVPAPMLAVQRKLPSALSTATASVPPTGVEVQRVARALETPGLLTMEVEEDVAMEVVEVRVT